MLCDKSSKTWKHQHPYFKQEVIRLANSEVRLSQLYKSISAATLLGKHSPWGCTPGTQTPSPIHPPTPHLLQNWKHLLQSRDWVSSPQELGLVQVSQTRLLRSAGEDLTATALEDWETYVRSTIPSRVDRSQNGKMSGIARRPPTTQCSLWLNVSNCTAVIPWYLLKVTFLGKVALYTIHLSHVGGKGMFCSSPRQLLNKGKGTLQTDSSGESSQQEAGAPEAEFPLLYKQYPQHQLTLDYPGVNDPNRLL